MPSIYIDADGCSVKNEVYKVSGRYGIKVFLVANRYHFTPKTPLVESVVVGTQFDAADDWIVEHIEPYDIVITSDIPLADRCIKAGARVLGAKGREFTENSIGSALAARDLNAHLRDMGVISGGPKPMQSKDKSRFLSKLDEMVNAALRETSE